MSNLLVLEVQLNGEVINNIRLESDTTYIGRLAENHVVLDDPEISRSHMCVIYDELRGYRIEDQASENGVFLNGQKISKAPIALGDRIELGKFVLRLIEKTNAEKAVMHESASGSEDSLNLNTTMNISEAEFMNADSDTYRPKVQLFFEMGSRMVEKEITFEDEVEGVPNYFEVELVYGSKRIRKRITF